MKFQFNQLSLLVGSCLIITSASSFANQPTEAVPNQDPTACTDQEILAVMAEYDASLGKIDKYHVPRFEKFRDVRMVHKAINGKEKNLCDVLANTKFKMPKFDFTKLKAAWASLKAFMAGDSQGMDWGKVMSEAYTKGLEKAKKLFLKGTCKLGQNFSKAAKESIADAYKDSKKQAKKQVENSKEAKKLGVKDLDKPLFQQIAKKKTDEQLGEYSKYAKWYDKDQWYEKDENGEMKLSTDLIKDNTSNLMDHLLDKADDRVDDLVKDNVSKDDKIGNILDSVKPHYK